MILDFQLNACCFAVNKPNAWNGYYYVHDCNIITFVGKKAAGKKNLARGT